MLHIQPGFLQLIDLLVYLSQLIVVSCPEISSICLFSDLPEHFFINLHWHVPGNCSAKYILNRYGCISLGTDSNGIDPDSKEDGLVINRTTTLRDTLAKMQKKSGAK